MAWDSRRFQKLAGILTENVACDPDEMPESTVESDETEDEEILESKMRAVIRSELKIALRELEEAQKSGNGKWILGSNKKSNSQPGRISRGFLGTGFKS